MEKQIFSYNPDISKNAYLNWRTNSWDSANNLIVLANGFTSAAIRLMNEVLIDNSLKEADILIFPVMYSVDQSIELYIKAVLYEIESLTMRKPNIYTTHDIESLFNTMIALVKKKEIKTAGLQKRLADIQDYISELYSYIKVIDANGKPHVNIDFARYPFDKDGNPHFYICTTENVVVNIENLLERYTKMIDELKGLYYMYEAQLEARNEQCQD